VALRPRLSPGVPFSMVWRVEEHSYTRIRYSDRQAGRQNQYTVDAGGTTIFCSALDGALAHGTCNMQFVIQPPPVYLALAPAQFTLRLMQRRADNSLVVLDSRTVDVVIVHS
jgi:hypothetical protein